LRQRVDQAIQSDEDAVVAFKIANLIDFYQHTLSRLVGNESSLLETLSALQASAQRQYRAIIKEHTEALTSEHVQPTQDLSIPDFLSEALQQLRELMKTYDSSLTPADSRTANFIPILTETLDPFLQICGNLAGKLEEPLKSIFTINCLSAVKVAFSSYDFAAERISEINDKIDEYAAKLVDYQHAFFLHTSGLHPLLAALAPLTDSEEDLKSVPTLEPFKPQALTDASQILDDFLPSALMDAMENLKQLKNLRIAEEVTAEAATRFCEDFEYVEGRLAATDKLIENESGDDESDIEDGEQRQVPLRVLFPRTSGEIRVLLS
jgi:hypothetical protein